MPSQQNQLRRVLDDGSVDLVMLTMGGNDAKFEKIANDCVMDEAGAAVRDATLLASGPELRLLALLIDQVEFVTGTGGLFCANAISKSKKLLDNDDDIRRRLTELYVQLSEDLAKGGSPSAPIMVLAYPLVFPADRAEACSRLSIATRGDVAFRATNQIALNDFVKQLNATVEKAVSAARRRGHPVVYVSDTQYALTDSGHTYCNPTENWINRISFETVYTALSNKVKMDDGDDGAWYSPVAWYRSAHRSLVGTKDYDAQRRHMAAVHPNSPGHRVTAQRVVDWAIEHPDPPQREVHRDDGAWRYTAVNLDDPWDLSEPIGSSIAPGSRIALTGSGFSPGSTIEVELHSDPELIGLGEADDDGNVRVLVPIRGDAPLGAHELVMTGVDPEGAERTLSQPVTISRSLPGWWWPAMIAAALVGLVAIALFIVWLWLRKRIRMPAPNLGSPSPATP